MNHSPVYRTDDAELRQLLLEEEQQQQQRQQQARQWPLGMARLLMCLPRRAALVVRHDATPAQLLAAAAEQGV
jgi:hypothetical protein